MKFLENKRFSFKFLWFFHVSLLVLFFIFKEINYWVNSSKSNYFFLASPFVILILLVLYFLFTYFKIRKLHDYAKDLCKKRIKIGFICSALSWLIFVVFSVFSVVISSQNKNFYIANWIAILFCFIFSAISIIAFNNLEKKFRYVKEIW